MSEAPTASAADSARVHVTYYRGKKSNKPQLEREGTWRSFVASLVEEGHERRKTKDGPLFSLVRLKDGKTRANEHVAEVHGWALDLDQADDEQIAGTLAALNAAGLAYVCYSTFSDSPKQQKLRAVGPLLEPMSANGWPRVWRALVTKFSPWADEQCKDVSRMYYLPACQPGAEPMLFVQPGSPLDVATLALGGAAPAPTRKVDLNAPDVVRGKDGSAYPRAPKGQGPFQHAEHLCHTMAPAVSGKGGHVAILRVARALRWGLELEAAQCAQMIAEIYSPRCDPPWSQTEIDHKIEAAGQDDGAPFARGALLPPPPDTFDDLPYVVCCTGRFWLRDFGANDYARQCAETDLVTVCRKKYADDPALPFHISEGDHPKPEHVKAWAQPVNKLVTCYYESTTTYDPEEESLTIGLRIDPKLVPQFNEHAEAWLAAIGGERLLQLKQWIAACRPDRLSAPARALGLVGPKELGKTLLAKALARIWDANAVPANVLCSQFNSALATCPIVMADEEIPPKLSGEEFRSKIADRDHSIEPKGKERHRLRGAVRLIVGVNNLSKFLLLGDKGANDVSAIADRLYVIDIPDAMVGVARNALAPLLADDGSTVDLAALAEHFLHIMATVEPTKGRFIGAPEDDTAQRITLQGEAERMPELWEIVAEYFESRGAWDTRYSLINGGTVVPQRGDVSSEGRINFPIITHEGQLFVRPGVLGQATGRDLSEVRKALKPFVKDTQAAVRIDGHRLSVWALDLDSVLHVVPCDIESVALTLSEDTQTRRDKKTAAA